MPLFIHNHLSAAASSSHITWKDLLTVLTVLAFGQISLARAQSTQHGMKIKTIAHMCWSSDICQVHRNKPCPHDSYEHWPISMLNTAQGLPITSKNPGVSHMCLQTSWWLYWVFLVVFQVPTGLLSAEILFSGFTEYIRTMPSHHGWSLVPRCCKADDLGTAQMQVQPQLWNHGAKCHTVSRALSVPNRLSVSGR